MKPFEIFRAGRHTSMSGATAEYTEAMLQAAVDAYDPALHPAPIVIGHPHDNHPAYGWVGKLSLDATGHVVAEPSDVNADFAELVAKKAYRTRSASWYLPDAPSNPKPGSLYLRHVGFLGAQPPAIKGLRDVSFADGEKGVVEFADPEVGMLASLMRRLRNFLIEMHGLEKADQVVPEWEAGELEAIARAPSRAEQEAATAQRSYTEPTTDESPPPTEETPVTPEQIAAVEAENARLKAELDEAKKSAQQAADFAERETELERRAAIIARREIETAVEGLVTAGKVLPTQKARVVDFAASLSAEGECLDFGEGDKSDKRSQRASYLALLEAGPKLVEFGEVARDERQGSAPKELTSREIGERAANFAEEQRKKGILISATDAVAHVTAEAEKRAS